MSTIEMHHTHIKEVKNGLVTGWEFGCSLCGYRVQYVFSNGDDTGKLEILDIGNPNARHSNIPIEDIWETNLQNNDLYQPTVNQFQEDEDFFLPIEIVRQIEAILNRFDFNP